MWSSRATFGPWTGRPGCRGGEEARTAGDHRPRCGCCPWGCGGYSAETATIGIARLRADHSPRNRVSPLSNRKSRAEPCNRGVCGCATGALGAGVSGPALPSGGGICDAGVGAGARWDGLAWAGSSPRRLSSSVIAGLRPVDRARCGAGSEGDPADPASEPGRRGTERCDDAGSVSTRDVRGSGAMGSPELLVVDRPARASVHVAGRRVVGTRRSCGASYRGRPRGRRTA